jgi:hypothetical protein
MPYVKQIKVETYEEFLAMAKTKDFMLAKGIVEKVLSNLNTKKKEIPVFEVEVGEEGAIYTLSMATSEFVDILEKNLAHYEREEEYEDCTKIIEAINYLKSKNG